MDQFVTLKDFEHLADIYKNDESPRVRRLAFALQELSKRYSEIIHADIIRVQVKEAL